MYVSFQIFSIVTIIIIYSSFSVFGNETDNCDCEVLKVESGTRWVNFKPPGLIGNQNFTKQNGTLNGKPYYFSTQKNMISWKSQYWSYDIYDD